MDSKEKEKQPCPIKVLKETTETEDQCKPEIDIRNLKWRTDGSLRLN
jgi:hypothetical protein